MGCLRAVTALCCAALLDACGGGSGIDAGSPPAQMADGWVGAWAAAPYGPFPYGPLTGVAPVDPLAITARFDGDQARDQSFRMVVHPTLRGEMLRVRLSNLMGTQPLRLEPVRVAIRAVGPAIVPGTDTAVRFDGQPAVTIAPGAEAVSDPVALSYADGDDLAVSFHVVGDSGPMTWHAVSFGLNYVSLPGSGDVTTDPAGVQFGQTSTGWFFISGIDVLAPDAGAIVALGDSITDGAYQVPESNSRWPDLLAQRLAAAGVAMSVLNQGINSNTVTRAGEGGDPAKGPAAEDRFDRDVLGRSGVRALVIFEGTNDLTAGVSGADVLAGIRRLIERAHAAGLCVVVGTIMPRDDLIFGWDRATMEAERQLINAGIRAMTGIEGIADFDAVMGSPLDPTRPNPLLYAPDLLHPTSLGFRVMADAVPIEALVPPPAGNCGA
ncbi:GDSL-type esterase/lipase family protein [Fontimonas sp. SYSU GA230001]|uniref:GDSL-type esterase/lipase family protein n=1 Tax=Fontimonas sp. SYSU GA230001 TaxID=3142450 RepID=UPI0032B4D2D9